MQTAPPDELLSAVEPILRGMGFQIVEFKSKPRRSALQVILVIHRREGVNLDDCTRVYKSIYPRLELDNDDRDVHLEVSSPGIERNIKSAHEFEIFMGDGAKVLEENESEWIRGVISGTTPTSVVLETDEGEREIGFDSIQKAQLDYSLGGQ